MERLFLSPPHITGNEEKYIHKVFKSNYIAPLGEYVTAFEESIKSYTGAENALALSSGTAALHLALRVSGVSEGDYVLTSSFTFIGSVTCIMYQKAKPVFVDSDEDSWNISPELLEKAIETSPEKPKVLIVTHLYGQCAEMNKILEICGNYGITVIEDAAEALGAVYQGRHAGTMGDYGVYSFNGNKIITTSGGGMLAAKDKQKRDKAYFYSVQAKEPFLHYEHEEYGYNYRMSNVLAAIGAGQMECLAERVRKKREIFEIYRNELSGISEITFMPELEETEGNRWLTTLTFEKTDIYKIINNLEEKNIESRPLWKPMHMQPVFSGELSVTDGTGEMLFAKGLCLPSGTAMTESDMARVIEIIKQSVK